MDEGEGEKTFYLLTINDVMISLRISAHPCVHVYMENRKEPLALKPFGSTDIPVQYGTIPVLMPPCQYKSLTDEWFQISHASK